MDILYLVDRLESLVANSRRVPLVNQIIIKEADILNIIDQMRTSIPGEVKQARRIMQEKDEILTQAQEEAHEVVMHAREEAEQSMSREGLLRAAEERAQEILRQANEQVQNNIQRAEEHTDQLQVEADSYALETLQNLREHLLSIETEIERTVMSIERGIDSLDGGSSAEGSDIEQERESRESREELHPLPRRTSLAADPSGGPSFQNQ